MAGPIRWRVMPRATNPGDYNGEESPDYPPTNTKPAEAKEKTR